MSNGEHRRKGKEEETTETIGETEKHAKETEGTGREHEERHGTRKDREEPMPRPGKVLTELLPEETMKHTREARKEFWLAIRSLVNARIKNIEKEEEEPSDTRRKIEIE